MLHYDLEQLWAMLNYHLSIHVTGGGVVIDPRAIYMYFQCLLLNLKKNKQIMQLQVLTRFPPISACTYYIWLKYGIKLAGISRALFVGQISFLVHFIIHCNVKNVRVDMGKLHSRMQYM